MRWALVKVCLAVTAMVVVAFAVPLGVGERPVAGHLLDDEPEGYGEGDDDHGGDSERHLDERPSHGCGSRGGSSFTPTPRRVCR